MNEVRVPNHLSETACNVLRYLEKIKPPVKDALPEARECLKCQDSTVREVAANLILAIDPVEGKKIIDEKRKDPPPTNHR